MWVEIQNGDEGCQDVSFDSKFMLVVLDNLDNSTHGTYFSIGVANNYIIYLVLDNMGGQG